MSGLAGAPAPRATVDAHALGTAGPWAAPTAVLALAAVVQQSVKGAVDGLLCGRRTASAWPRPVGTAVAAAVVSSVGVGVTRVWLGVRRLSDVLGGRPFGALVVAPGRDRVRVAMAWSRPNRWAPRIGSGA
ncbi:hypothetical protein ACWCQS_24235 [Streptomyces sp. NPDC002076]